MAGYGFRILCPYALDVVEDESEGAEESAVAVPGAPEAAAPRRTLTIRSGYVPKPHVDNEITITEPLSSNTVELRAAQARERRAMRGTNEPLTHQTVGKNGRRRFVKKSLMTAHSSRRVSPAVRAWIAAAPPLGSALAW